jgi:putative nucleotidyltransferase with HDIG domain
LTDNLRSVLVVDDDENIRRVCRELLESNGFEVWEASDGLKAEALLETRSFSLVLSDIIMPGTGGIELLKRVRQGHPDTEVILFTGHGSIDLAKDAIRRGAFDFVTKPFGMDDLLRTVERAREARNRRISQLPHPALDELRRMTEMLDIAEFSPHEYLLSFAESVKRSFRADAVRVYTAATEGGMELEVSCGREELINEGDWQEALEACLEDGEEGFLSPETQAREPLPSRRRAHMLAARLHGGDGPLGACVGARAEIPDPFTGRDLKTLSLFCAQAGNQLQSYNLAEGLRSNARQLQAINRVVSGFSSTLDTERVLSSIGKGFSQLIDYDILGVMIREEEANPLAYFRLRSDLPDSVFLYGPLRESLLQDVSVELLDQSLQVRVVETFGAEGGPVDTESLQAVRKIQLSEFSNLNGLLFFASWRPETAEAFTSKYLPILARQAISALSNARFHERGERNYIQTIGALASAVDAKDPYTHNHSRNVTAYALSLADYLGMGETDQGSVRNAALLHDIGKIGVPDSILNKPGSLTDDEFAVMKTHPELGYRILKPVHAFRNLVQAVRYHHERYDGGGYPAGLSGKEIPLMARILTVADAFDAMYSDRVYRPSPGLDYAKAELRENAGSQFDPSLAYSFLEVLTERTPEELLAAYAQTLPR